MNVLGIIFGKKPEDKAKPEDAPIGTGAAEKAKQSLSGRGKQLDDMERKAVGYKDGGLVRMTPKSTPYKCGK